MLFDLLLLDLFDFSPSPVSEFPSNAGNTDVPEEWLSWFVLELEWKVPDLDLLSSP